MTRVGKSLLCGAMTLSLCGACAATAENPYAAIIDRNVFGIKDPPPPPPPPGSEKKPPSPLTLTGITTINGKPQVLLKTAGAPPKPGEQAKGDQYYILTEGIKQDDIEVLEIDPKANVVKVRYAGDALTLDFEKNGPKLPSTPAPAVPGAPGVPARLPGVPVPPTAMPTFGGVPSPTGALNPGLKSIPTRSTRTDGLPAPSPVPTSALNVPLGASGTMPNYGYNTVANTPTGQPQAPQPVLTPEEQEVITEAHREYLRNKNDPRASIMPPTRFTPALPPMPGQTQPAQQNAF